MYNGQQQQNHLEFLSFIPTPNEKFIGIATIRLERRFVFRFKIVPNANGQGVWVTKAAYKVGVKADGKDLYEDAFECDSSFEKKQIDAFVEQNVQSIIARPNPNASPSAFAQHQQAHYQTPQHAPHNSYNAQSYDNQVPSYANSPMPDLPDSSFQDEPNLPF